MRVDCTAQTDTFLPNPTKSSIHWPYPCLSDVSGWKLVSHMEFHRCQWCLAERAYCRVLSAAASLAVLQSHFPLQPRSLPTFSQFFVSFSAHTKTSHQHLLKDSRQNCTIYLFIMRWLTRPGDLPIYYKTANKIRSFTCLKITDIKENHVPVANKQKQFSFAVHLFHRFILSLFIQELFLDSSLATCSTFASFCGRHDVYYAVSQTGFSKDRLPFALSIYMSNIFAVLYCFWLCH